MSIATSVSQDFNGASVTFEAGAEVSNIKLSSDFSAIQILGLPPQAGAGAITVLLAGLVYQVLESNVVVRSLGDAGSVAEVKFEDPKFAKEVTRKFDSLPDKSIQPNISIKPIFRNAATGALVNRLQLSTVTCTWYKPSRPAWLAFECHDDARRAKEVIETCEIRQRKPTCAFQTSGRYSLSHTLQIGNLDFQTREKEMYMALRGSKAPESITLGDPTHSHSDAETANMIECLLRSKRALESFQWKVLPGNTKLKATAIFGERDEAAEAVRSLNGTILRKLGNSKLFLDHIISVKYNVPNSIVPALEADIEKLGKEIWQSGHVRVNLYPQTEQAKSFTAVKISGESLKHVAKAKARMEKLLAGTIVLDGDVALWDPDFLNATALAYLNEISKTNKLYIHRDARKSHLILYGGSETSRSEVVSTLQAKILTLRQLAHAIILTPDLLVKAMQGGMQRLKIRFGSVVKLNISVSPKIISIAGSNADLEEARAILVEDTCRHSRIDPDKETIDCAVCWTEATDALTTNCGHVYCKDCFASQAASGDLPVRCYGAEGTCLQVFPLTELATMLSHQAFQELLESSFDAYIRQRPKEFQHCPTPDFPQVYRITTSGDAFLCSICLSLVCTVCNVIAHEGITCEEYKDLSSGGTKAFEKWKKESDARDCPNCGAVIQKTEGCNHMECQQCSTHICWFCMKNFGTGSDCYGHMQKVHGNFYG